MEKYICHDCGKKLKNNDEYVPYETAGGVIVKCKKCHQKDPALRNFQKTEVYSRIVGYIRPIEQWNNGKREEYADRKEYVVGDPACC
jgi:anaerobic ribonucleoside-triphosphate reductase